MGSGCGVGLTSRQGAVPCANHHQDGGRSQRSHEPSLHVTQGQSIRMASFQSSALACPLSLRLETELRLAIEMAGFVLDLDIRAAHLTVLSLEMFWLFVWRSTLPEGEMGFLSVWRLTQSEGQMAVCVLGLVVSMERLRADCIPAIWRRGSF